METPRYEYSRKKLQERISLLSSLKAPYGLTVRYAVKANPHREIVDAMHSAGLHFDASSSYEASALIEQGVSGANITLSSQQSAHNLEELLSSGVLYTATSMHQIEQFIRAGNRPRTLGMRINPDMGYGHNNRTSTGGVSASFGIWHEYIPNILELTESAGIHIDRLHIHIGSGADSHVWGSVMDRALHIVDLLESVSILNIGGGYKVHRYGEEKEADIEDIMKVFSEKLEAYKERTGRGLHLEIEPGTYAVAHIGTLVARVDDIVDTGKEGYTFLRLNTGMNDFLRSTLYGARHEIEVISEETEQMEYVVVGHNCESGDILTPAGGDPEGIEPRLLKKAKVGDEVRMHDVGAYCASMRARGYNSYPEAKEFFIE